MRRAPTLSAISIICGTPSEILAMHHHVERERQARRHTAPAKRVLRSCAPDKPGDAIAVVGGKILEAQLHMLQPGRGKASISRAAQGAGG